MLNDPATQTHRHKELSDPATQTHRHTSDGQSKPGGCATVIIVFAALAVTAVFAIL